MWYIYQTEFILKKFCTQVLYSKNSVEFINPYTATCRATLIHPYTRHISCNSGTPLGQHTRVTCFEAVSCFLTFFFFITMSKSQVQSGGDFWKYYEALIVSQYVLQPCGAHLNNSVCQFAKNLALSCPIAPTLLVAAWRLVPEYLAVKGLMVKLL